MHLVEKHESPTIVQSSIEILSRSDDIVKQQEEGLLIVELVAGADANASASKEPESQGVHSSVDVQNEKNVTNNNDIQWNSDIQCKNDINSALRQYASLR